MSAHSRIRSIGLRQALSLGMLQTVLRLVIGFVSIKVTAVWIGPAGLALVAQINNFVALCQGVIANPAATAVVRLGGEFADRPERRREVGSTAMQLVLGLSLLVALPVALMAAWISPRLLAGEAHAAAVIAAAIAVPALAFTNIVSSSFNAVGEIGVMAHIRNWGTIAGFLIFVPAARFYGIDGALLATAGAYIAGAAIAAWFLRSGQAIPLAEYLRPPTREMLRRTLGFYPMLIVHAALTPATLLLMRDRMVASVGLEATGLWQAGWRLSETYLALLMAPFSMYFMAKLGSLIGERAEFRREVLRGAVRAAGLTAVAALAILLLRTWVVRIVFAPTFAPVVDLLPWQLAGDIVRMTAWILTMTLTALMRARWFVASEIAKAATMVGFAAMLSAEHGAVAANWGYFAAGVLQLLIAGFGLRDLLTEKH